MKGRISKRLLSLIFAVIMVVSVVPVSATKAEALSSARQTAVDYMNAMATVKWTAGDKFRGYKMKKGQYFYKGITYTGIPYSQASKIHSNMNLAAFSSYINGTVYSDIGRNDCSSAVWNAWYQAGYRGYPTPFSTKEMLAGRNNRKYGIIPVELAKLQPGDAVVNSSHTMLVTGNDGNYLYFTHNTGSFSEIYKHPYSTWAVNQKISLDYIKKQGYVGVTFVGLSGSTTSLPTKDDPYVDKNAVKTPGAYRSNGDPVALRSEPATITGYRHFYIPRYTEIYVTETKYNWGKCTYNGITGWTCLDYYTQVSIPDAAVPRINDIAAKDVAQGTLVTVNWAAVSNATKYKISVNGGGEIDLGNNTIYSLKLDQAKTYTFKVQAYNSVDKASGWSNTVSCTAHAPCNVTFADSDGSPIETIKVAYGKDASFNAPSKEGYTFQGWDGSTKNITKDVTLKAIYKVNTYYVKFWGADNKQLGATQKVNYHEDAVPPTDTQAPEGNKFVRWSSEDYKNVFTKAEDKTINIYAVYEWANENIPLTCQITKAYRDSDGYHVLYDIVNNVSAKQTGRAIISLKTAEGKLIYTTESKTFAIAGNSIKKNIDEFFECDETASVIEIIIVDDYKNGTPLSVNVSSQIENGLGWSNWVDANGEIPEGAETRTLYRYKDKTTTTTNTKTLDGWTYAGTYKSNVGLWSKWQDGYIASINSDSLVRKVETQTVTTYKSVPVYNYYRYAAQWLGGNSAVGWKKDKPTDYYYTADHELEYGGISSDDGVTAWYKFWYYNESVGAWKYIAVYKCGTGVNTGGTYITYNQVANGTKTQYRYQDTTYTYDFYKWTNWSGWSTDAVTANSTRTVETKKQYRTFNGVEDTSGKTYDKEYFVGTEFADRQVTLFVYKFDAASDYTDEYVAQTKVDSEGYCNFTVKLREEPSDKTGDFTFALGIEGTSNTFIVDTLEAPKPKYKVYFYDWDGSLIETQTVEEGKNAVLPSYTPTRDGYDFVGWSDSLTNIRQEREIFADMKIREYQVVFIDWENKLFEISTFKHGDVLETPEIAEVDGLVFKGWDKINEGKTVVTGNMVVTAQYEKEQHTVTFYDFDGNVLETQIVPNGETALPPDDIESDDGKRFAGWFNPDDYQFVEDNEHIYPTFYFDETTEVPEASHYTGEYNGAIKLTLTTPDENAVIYYYLGDDQSTEAIYTGPITIDKTTTVTYYATSFGKNDSETYTEYYCINSDDVSGWMLQSELPADVTADSDRYIIESKKGYRYKDTQSTELISVSKSLLNNGWKWESSKWSDYTAWQDTKINADSKYIEHQIETHEVDDTSVTWYQYSHYKYTKNGVVKYSPTEVEGYECTYETTVSPTRITPYDIYEDGMNFIFEINGQDWFGETNVPGRKTQYRSRYKICTYYKWTDWGTTAPASGETRTYETNTIYRYSVQNYHIVDIIDGFGDMPITSLVKHGSVIDTSSLETEGYTFNGLYTDEALTTAFGATTPVTERLTLYAKYTPKTYTVTFKGPNGYNFGSQQVEYLTAAQEPATFSFANWVFVGWDKDFDCITEDTVVQGMYIAKSEYAYITLDRTSADMYQGTSISLIPTITPSDLTNGVVEWSTSDPSIATVDDKGNVTAVAAGEVTITATVVKSREKASCTISVAADKANFIVLKSDTYLGYDSLGYLRGVKLNTTTSTLSREFTNVTLKYKNMSGTELGENSLIGTGSTIMLYNGFTLVDSKVAIVTGDMTGDGIINNRDVVMMNKYLLNKVEAQECQTIATDVNGDGYVNNKDAAMVARYMVGKENF